MPSLPATHPVIGSNEDDTLTGNNLSDVMSGRAGNDVLTGNNGNDEIWGGTGDDTLSGNNGDDIIFGSGGPILVETPAVEIVDDYPVSVIFEGETAGYKNTFGTYKVDEADRLYDVEIIWQNASLKYSGGDLIQGESQEFLDVSAGDRISFFIVSNGFNTNRQYQGLDLDNGSLAFRNDDGSQATLDSINPKLVHIASDGAETEIVVDKYHTAGYGEHANLNADGLLHTAGVLKADAGTLTIGFEDLYNGGDRDFDDSVFTVDIGTVNAQVLNAHYQSDPEDDVPADGNSGDQQPVEPPPSDNDILSGGTGQDELHGRSGNDTLKGENGNDQLHGGSGDDTVEGNSGNDKGFGNSGDDTLSGGKGSDTLSGNSGNDILHGDDQDDILLGGHGDDGLNGGNHDDSLVGGSGDDVLSGGYGDDTLLGGAGDDTLEGGGNDDTMIGGYGDDVMDGGYGDDTVKGGAGDDTLSGGHGDDIIQGGHGDDLIKGDAGDDEIHGGRGINTIDYSDYDVDLSILLHNKRAHGLEIGTDTLKYIQNAIAGDGDDSIKGTSGDNVIDGNAGNDSIRGLGGADTMSGGAGEDHFIWRSYDITGDLDVILDFDLNEDVLDLSTAFNRDTDYMKRLDYMNISSDLDGTLISINIDQDRSGFDDLVLLKGVQIDDLVSLTSSGRILLDVPGALINQSELMELVDNSPVSDDKADQLGAVESSPVSSDEAGQPEPVDGAPVSDDAADQPEPVDSAPVSDDEADQPEPVDNSPVSTDEADQATPETSSDPDGAPPQITQVQDSDGSTDLISLIGVQIDDPGSLLDASTVLL